MSIPNLPAEGYRKGPASAVVRAPAMVIVGFWEAGNACKIYVTGPRTFSTTGELILIGVRGFPARGYFIPGRDGGVGGQKKFRVVVAVVA